MEFSRCKWNRLISRTVLQNSAACDSAQPAACQLTESRSTLFLGELDHRTAISAINESSSLLGSRDPAFPRKEVIQPQLPLRLPCYDFTPVTNPTFGGCLPQGVSTPTSGVAGFRGVTGGVYKARERIHRGIADPRLLATPPSWRRVSASNPNRDRLFGIRSPSRVCSPLYRPM
jgi:hypothetical protein